MKQAKATELADEADKDTTAKVFEKETAKEKDIKDQIAECVIKAQRKGMLVYYFSPQSQGGFGSRQPAIAQGEPVSEGQKMLRIPNLSKMLVRAKVHESMLRHVAEGQHTKILIDALPGESFKGHVKQVAAVPSLIDIFASDVKLFEAEIKIEDSLEGYNVKPQMTARVIITAE